jgi:hypothetical protein
VKGQTTSLAASASAVGWSHVAGSPRSPRPLAGPTLLVIPV